MRQRTIASTLALFSCGAIAACTLGTAEERPAMVAEAVLGGTHDDSSPTANIVVAIESADGTKPACSGALVTPTVVITARQCVDPARVGTWPTVRVGTAFATANRYFSTRLPLVEPPGVNDGSPGSVDANGQLALIYLPRQANLWVSQSGSGRLPSAWYRAISACS